ncbi:GNAT family N-acetyltransferase [Sediminibacillus albus]|uniref:N-acetyltransferase domain-containing protein n=1 Tax=Sediminibacillus albus TaxID=407036 RepID=A0A1G8YTB7_9BACI|nr:GNAT family N-acetyltransferase [Sediminibacillus albus]SDK06048.1 hypothetical protein SAMN05216243_1817 [Sediminibacillus albus]
MTLPQGLLQIRRLNMEDWDTVKQMKTNIEDDYVVNIFPDLVSSSSQVLYGMFSDNQLLAIAGYSVFPGGLAMLGRLRSDSRFLSKGHATELLGYIITELKKQPDIIWVGANTNEQNQPARRVLEKLQLSIVTKLHSLPVAHPEFINGTAGSLWAPVDSRKEKRALLESLTENAINSFPYECYYPLPLTQQLITDEYLDSSAFYQNHDGSRFLSIKTDRKREWYGQVKYFWNDHFEQPGFWETAFHYAKKSPVDPKIWMDFSEVGFSNIPDKRAFTVADAWVLYGSWI